MSRQGTLVALCCLVALFSGASAQLQFLNHTYFTQAVSVAEILSPCPTSVSSFKVVEATISDIHQAFLNGSLTCSELVKAYIQRIKAYDDLTGLNAVHYLNKRAGAIAAKKDKQLKKIRDDIALGKPNRMPPLFCVPFLFKDNYDAAGTPTTNGGKCLADNVAPQDATQVKQVKDAGALWIAKTNMAEWAMGGTFSTGAAFGISRNPYDLNRASSGSSGGTGAGIAASFAMIGFGTDTCVSIRGPASHQGLVGIRPSLGLTSRAGIVPLRLSWDTGGPIGRTVTDVAKVFSVLTGYDPRDPLTSQSNNYTVPPDYTAYLDPNGLTGARIGVYREFLTQNNNAPAVAGIPQLPDPDYLAMFEAALVTMTAAGATIIDNFSLPNYKQILSNETDFVRQPNGAITRATFRQIGSGSVKYDGYFENVQGCAVFKFDMNDYLATAGTKFKSIDEIAATNCMHPNQYVGVRITPAAANYTRTTYYTDPRFSGAKCKSCGDYQDCPCRMSLRDALIKKMDEMQLDALVYLTFNNPPITIGSNEPAGNANCQLSAITGAPAITIPAGFVRKASPQPFGGSTSLLPVGLQLLSRPFDEKTLFKLSYAFEQKAKARVPPVAFPECGTPGIERPIGGRRMLSADAGTEAAMAMVTADNSDEAVRRVVNAPVSTGSMVGNDPEAGW